MYETIQTPFNYGGLTLKNRIIFAPTTFGLSDEDYFEKIRRIAAGGCAMIIVGDVPVGKSHFGKSLFDKKGFAFYEKVIGIAHDNDCKVCAQLHQSDSNIKAMLKYVPGVLTKRISMQELRPLLNNEVAPYITNMPHKKVKEITSAFGTAAVLAKKAGFDMIQIHGDRMCGSFSSSIYNHRTDEYGGTAGLLTIEDLVEVIVGDIDDEYDEEEEEIVKINDNEYLVEGSTKISDVNEQLGINLESEEFDSIGGFIIGYLKRIPEENEIIEVEDVKFKVESIDKNRINKIRIFV